VTTVVTSIADAGAAESIKRNEATTVAASERERIGGTSSFGAGVQPATRTAARATGRGSRYERRSASIRSYLPID
jgi:hypothetical protein